MLFFHFDVHFLFAFLKENRSITVQDGMFYSTENHHDNLTNDPRILVRVIERVRTIYLNPNEAVNEQTRSIKENRIFDEAACIKKWCALNHENEYWRPLISVFNEILEKHSS